MFAAGFVSTVKRRVLNIVLLLSVLLLVLIFTALFFGAASVDISSLLTRFIFSADSIVTSSNPIDTTIIFSLRLPRILLAAFVGATLSLGGAVFQALLRNPLAEPYILGISGGSALGAIIGIIYGVTAIVAVLPLAAFLGAIATIFIVFVIAPFNRASADGENILLTGVVVNAFFSAMIIFLISTSSAEQMQSIMFWLMGDLSVAGYRELVPLIAITAICFVVIYAHSRQLNTIMLGENEALLLGVNVRKTKFILLLFTSLAIGAAVSVSGIIGFVGIIVPHITKLIYGYDNRILLPASTILGAVFVIIADTFARTMVAPVELPVGVVTAMLGVPYFIFLMKKKNRGVSSNA